MREYLELKSAKCKNCYKCLRGCPVKAIKVINHQARIIKEACVLCGKCALNCPQGAKHVVDDTEYVLNLLQERKMVIASVAPSFVSSFGINNFQIMINALKKLGFYGAEETAVGAKVVTSKYYELLKTHNYKNFITSACPSVNRLIQTYYPNAVQYLAPIDSPMITHAKMIKEVYKDATVIFIGPCISKKREADESNGVIDGVLTFEELNELFKKNNIELEKCDDHSISDEINTARYYPISRGIIKSFYEFVKGYQYVAIDGLEKCKDALDSIDQMEGMFFEMNSCEYACINGPCKIATKGGNIKANADVRKYVTQATIDNTSNKNIDVDVNKEFIALPIKEDKFSESQIRDVLLRTGKKTKEDELNCGACGYNTCREKAIAVLKGYADIEMCVSFMRERAESMSNEIIKNSPYGIIVIDMEYKILEINDKAKSILGEYSDIKGNEIFNFMDANEFIMATVDRKNRFKKALFIPKTKKYIDLSVSLIKDQDVMFGMMEDVTDETNYDKKIESITMQTLETTDDVIKKQMRVAQEIASLLGEVTAETKVALLNLKKTLQTNNQSGNNNKNGE